RARCSVFKEQALLLCLSSFLAATFIYYHIRTAYCKMYILENSNLLRNGAAAPLDFIDSFRNSEK
ncbi:hypothetical protein, partial [Paenibacillus thermotolerans]|uniref:hypothetical protein n=1 Tax=Paenibacillus thermotolerans TaxID=3027807 RepID=UPI0023688DE3